MITFCHRFVPAAAVASLLGLAVAAPASAATPPQATMVVCTNPASGATWPIRIDLQRGAVDANPATITASEITWHDPGDGGHYTLDRASGALTVIIASSTGGYFLHDHCALK